MRRLFAFAALAAVLFSAGCACGAEATGVQRSSCSAPFASPCSTPAASACSSSFTPLSVVGDYAVEYGQPGAREQAKALFTIPAGAIDCVTTGAAEGLVVIGKTARCLVNSFFPPLEPSSRLVRLQTQGAVQSSACGPQTVDVEEQYQEPETRMVTKTRTVRKVVVPIQNAPVAPRANPCAPAPAPQATPVQPKSGCEPPPSASVTFGALTKVCREGDPDCDPRPRSNEQASK